MGSWSSKTSMPSMAGKVTIVTGANCGIGYYTAMQLGRAGARLVVLACRDASRAQTALDKLKAECPDGNFETMVLDLARLESVREFCTTFLARDLAIDLLICNAGVMDPKTLMITDDGYELQMATNHLGHFALTGGLMPALLRGGSQNAAPEAGSQGGQEGTASSAAKAAGDTAVPLLPAEPFAPSYPRVVVVSSLAAWTGDLSNFRKLSDDTELGERDQKSGLTEPAAAESPRRRGPKNSPLFVRSSPETYNARRSYCDSKLANLLFAKELARRYEGRLMVTCAHPGVTQTDLFRHMSSTPVPGFLLMDTPRGAEPTLRAATSTLSTATGNVYFGPLWGMRGGPVNAYFPRQSKDTALADALWRASIRASGIDY